MTGMAAQAPLVERFVGRPVAIDPARARAVVAALGGRMAGSSLAGAGSARDDTRSGGVLRASALTDAARGAERSAGLRVPVVGGVAIIEVTGTLVHRSAWAGEAWGLTSYQGIAAQLRAAAEDPEVRGIALEIDSAGGEVAGLFDLADQLRAVAARKPVRAFVAESALSAAYALASQAGRVVMARTGEAGSIGVIWIHADYSGALAGEGVEVTLVQAGAHKADGNPFEPLPAEVRERVRSELEQVRSLFARTVGAGRGGRLSEAAALATEAQVFRGSAAVTAGLVDEVRELRAAFADFVAEVGRRPRAAAAGAAVRQARGMGMEDRDVGDPAGAAAAADGAVGGSVPAVEACGPAVEARVRVEEAAELVRVGAQAARLGVDVDVAAALREGVTADALRERVLTALAERADARDVVAAAPRADMRESPVVAAARKAAEQATRRMAR